MRCCNDLPVWSPFWVDLWATTFLAPENSDWASFGVGSLQRAVAQFDKRRPMRPLRQLRCAHLHSTCARKGVCLRYWTVYL